MAKYTVRSLIEALKEYPQDAQVLICMDWTALPEDERPSQAQWEDALGDIACSNKDTAPHIYLLNESFK